MIVETLEYCYCCENCGYTWYTVNRIQNPKCKNCPPEKKENNDEEKDFLVEEGKNGNP